MLRVAANGKIAIWAMAKFRFVYELLKIETYFRSRQVQWLHANAAYMKIGWMLEVEMQQLYHMHVSQVNRTFLFIQYV